MTERSPTVPPEHKPPRACPKCGVPIAPGYVRCPKCRSKLPSRSPSTVTGGGIALPEGKGTIWLVFAALALLGGVALVLWPRFAAYRERKLSALRVDAAVGALDTNSQVAAPPDMPGAAVPDGAAVLRAALLRAGQTATFTVDGDELEIQSTTCTAPALMGAVRQNAATLRASEIANVRCVDSAGEVMFELAL